MENQEVETKEVGNESEVKTVDVKAYEEVRGDMFKYKNELRVLQEERESLLAEKRKMEEMSLKEQQKYKELYERKEQEAGELKSKLTSVSEAIVEDKKFRALEKEALNLGLRSEALNDLRNLDTSSVIVESNDNGNVSVLGAKEFVESLKRERGFWFSDNTAPKVNNTTPGLDVSEKRLSSVELVALQKKDPKAYKEEMNKLFKRN